MFVVWEYLYVTYWDASRGFRVVVEIIYKHMIPSVIDHDCRGNRNRESFQQESSYG